MQGRRARVVHVITDTGAGGAELALYRLLASRRGAERDAMVISLGSVGLAGEKMEALGIRVSALQLRRAKNWLGGLWRLVADLRRERPEVVQTWMYHADLLGGVAARVAGVRTVVWGLRDTLSEHPQKATTAVVMRACARLSRIVPTAIVSCSEAGCRWDVTRGYDPQRITVIPNGFSVRERDYDAGAAARREVGVSSGTVVITRVGRLVESKDYTTMVRAASRLVEQKSGIHFLFCGAGVTEEDELLVRLIHEAGVGRHVSLLGRRRDMENLLAATDIACSSSSYGEGFPNVVGEAMAAGVPVVATDVGDSARLLGDGGRLVPAKDPDALAEEIGGLIDVGGEERRRIGEIGRTRIQRHYTLEHMAERYESLYESLIS